MWFAGQGSQPWRSVHLSFCGFHKCVIHMIMLPRSWTMALQGNAFERVTPGRHSKRRVSTEIISNSSVTWSFPEVTLLA